VSRFGWTGSLNSKACRERVCGSDELITAWPLCSLGARWHAHLRPDLWPPLLLTLGLICCGATSNAVFSSSGAVAGETD